MYIELPRRNQANRSKKERQLGVDADPRTCATGDWRQRRGEVEDVKRGYASVMDYCRRGGWRRKDPHIASGSNWIRSLVAEHWRGHDQGRRFGGRRMGGWRGRDQCRHAFSASRNHTSRVVSIQSYTHSLCVHCHCRNHLFGGCLSSSRRLRPRV